MKKLLTLIALMLMTLNISAQNSSEDYWYNLYKIQEKIDAVGDGNKAKIFFLASKKATTNAVYWVCFENEDHDPVYLPAYIKCLVYHDTGDSKEFLGIEVDQDIFHFGLKIGTNKFEIKLDDVSAQYLLDFRTNDTKWENKTDIGFRETKSPQLIDPVFTDVGGLY